MAALLKKRALAEYSQSQTIVETPPEPVQPKRLRLVKKPGDNVAVPGAAAVENDINSLDPNKSSEENFQTLSRIVASLPTTEPNVLLLRQKLLQLQVFGTENSALNSKCMNIMQLLSVTKTDALTSAGEVIHILSSERSSLTIITGLTVVHKLAKICDDRQTESRLIRLAKECIKKSDAKIKIKCLEILGDFTVLDDPSVVMDTLQFVHCYTHSGDPKVRSSAFKVLLQLHDKGAPLEKSMYAEVIKYLNDDYEIVKLAAIQLLFAISQAHPEQIVRSQLINENMRLIDDAFVHMCTAINDPCVQVRVSAATFLGKMVQVGPTFLEQTLDKKLMSDMRRKRSAHERKWEKVKAGEWSSGKKWADDAPKELIDADSVSLISSGAAGAFIHGLEDEYLEVRSAAVDSLCALAMLNKSFANLALDFLVDMFNDEIEEVRLKAIDSLGKISEHIVLWEDHLDIILSVLEDSSIDIREGLHKVLGVSHMMTKDCVKMCVENLLENLRKCPHDKLSIWKCLEGIGKNHSWTVLPLVPNLLSTHPFFDTPETDPEDPAYVAVLILVFNAAKGCRTMSAQFEAKFVRHYRYLRDTLPHLVPDLNLGDDDRTNGLDIVSTSFENGTVDASSSSAAAESTGPRKSGKIVLRELIEKLKESENLSPDMKLNLSRLILQDVKRLAEVDEEVSGVAKLTALYLRAQIVYTNSIIGSTSWKQLSQNSQNDNLKLQIQKLLQLCLKMQYGFSGLTPDEFVIVLQLKLRALVFQLIYIVKGSNASALAITQNLLEQAENVQKYLEDKNIQPDDFTLSLFKILDSLDEPKPGTLTNLLVPLFEKHPLPFVCFTSSVKMCSATVIEPTGDSDTPLEFTTGLLLGIQFDGLLQNLTDRNHVRIRVKYPDQQVHLIRPRINDFRSCINREDTIRLLTQVIVSHRAWTEPCPVTLSVVLDLSGPETNYNRKLVGKNDAMYTVQLSQEKQVLISPRHSKKNL